MLAVPKKVLNLTRLLLKLQMKPENKLVFQPLCKLSKISFLSNVQLFQSSQLKTLSKDWFFHDWRREETAKAIQIQDSTVFKKTYPTTNQAKTRAGQNLCPICRVRATISAKDETVKFLPHCEYAWRSSESVRCHSITPWTGPKTETVVSSLAYNQDFNYQIRDNSLTNSIPVTARKLYANEAPLS